MHTAVHTKGIHETFRALLNGPKLLQFFSTSKTQLKSPQPKEKNINYRALLSVFKCLNWGCCFYIWGFVVSFVGVFWLFWGGWENPEIPQAIFTNRQNKSLISVDRRTSLLSHVQYSVLYQSRLQWIYRSQCPKGDEYGVGPKPIATREHRDRKYRRFPA